MHVVVVVGNHIYIVIDDYIVINDTTDILTIIYDNDIHQFDDKIGYIY